jgi:hypothetical protein
VYRFCDLFSSTFSFSPLSVRRSGSICVEGMALNTFGEERRLLPVVRLQSGVKSEPKSRCDAEVVAVLDPLRQTGQRKHKTVSPRNPRSRFHLTRTR